LDLYNELLNRKIKKAAGIKHPHELRKPTTKISEWTCKYVNNYASYAALILPVETA